MYLSKVGPVLFTKYSGNLSVLSLHCSSFLGGPGAAHEAEEFTWSDHTVVPIKCTGGAAGGKFKVPEKIFEVGIGFSRDGSE